ncbi:MAG: hypothetical protein ACE5HO_17790 [bacterium]
MTTVTVNASSKSKRATAIRLIKTALEREQDILRAGLEKTLAALATFEKKYNMTSQKFFEAYQNGNTDDRNDYVDWAGEYQIYLSIKEQMEAIEDMNI